MKELVHTDSINHVIDIQVHKGSKHMEMVDHRSIAAERFWLHFSYTVITIVQKCPTIWKWILIFCTQGKLAMCILLLLSSSGSCCGCSCSWR